MADLATTTEVTTSSTTVTAPTQDKSILLAKNIGSNPVWVYLKNSTTQTVTADMDDAEYIAAGDEAILPYQPTFRMLAVGGNTKVNLVCALGR